MLGSECRQQLMEYQALSKISRDGFLAVSEPDARILDVNETLCEMLGYTRDELLSLRMTDLDKGNLSAVSASARHKHPGVIHDCIEAKYRHKLGHFIDLEISASQPVSDAGIRFSFLRDITARKRTEAALRFLTRRVWKEGGENFFDALVKYLGVTLGVDYVFIGGIESPPGMAETVALYAKGKLASKLRYDLGGTPCEQVLKGEFCFYPQGIQQLFPLDATLAEMGAQSYSGIPLRDSDGQPIGLIGVIDSKPLLDESHLFDLLQLMAIRAAAELERERGERALREREHQFHSLTESSLDNIVRRLRDVPDVRDTERQLEHFVANLPGMAYALRLTPEGHAGFPYVSPAIASFYGLKPEEVKDDIEPIHRLIHPEDLPRIESAIIESARTMMPFRAEYRICRHGQPERWLEARSIPEREAYGSVLWYGLLFDITERKQAEQYEQCRSQALELLAAGATLIEVLECIVRGVESLHPAMLCSVLLLDSQGQHLVDGIAPSLPDFYNAAIDGVNIGIGMGSCGTAAATGARVIVEDIATHPYWAPFKDLALSAGLGSCWSEPVRSLSGKVLGTFAIYHRFAYSPSQADIAIIEKSAHLVSIAIEHKRMAESLVAREHEFRSLAENLPDIVIRYDREGRRTYVNPAFGQMFLTRGEDLIGLTQQQANPAGLPENYQQALKHTLATGERSEFEIMMNMPSGGVHNGHVVITAEQGVDGQIHGAITIGRDITQLKQAELQLRELTAHIQTVREEEKAHLAREIHDDLASTLAVLNWKVSRLRDFEFPEEMKHTPLYAHLESMSPLLKSALTSARRIITDMRPDVLDNLGLFAALKWHAEQFHKHTGIECRITCSNVLECEECNGSEKQPDKTLSINLFRIFQEALSNVARHSGASRVEAKYGMKRGGVVLSVSDNGCGMQHGHIQESTSFGIRGMRERVGQLGGKIEFDSPAGGGFCVKVSLPLLCD